MNLMADENEAEEVHYLHYCQPELAAETGAQRKHEVLK
jgi:hypothetical protein